jgi:hypothetical protein
MAAATSDEDALKIGIESAQELACLVKQKARGLYLMPPFGSAAIAEQVMDAVL